ncbi:MAG: hypothetical protein MZW92_00575 [Comamonadaceae bacterium]|nr:hypothetical protein [Comamonadaceae bacterium]
MIGRTHGAQLRGGRHAAARRWPTDLSRSTSRDWDRLGCRASGWEYRRASASQGRCRSCAT